MIMAATIHSWTLGPFRRLDPRSDSLTPTEPILGRRLRRESDWIGLLGLYHNDISGSIPI
jgi:hypothetical protein